MRSLRTVVLAATVVAIVQLLTAGASASVRYDPLTTAGFIGRGDVIASLGKQGLVASPSVLVRYRHDWVLDCPTEAGGREIVEGSTLGHALMLPTPRRAANGSITGYVLPGTLLDSFVEQPQGLCGGLPGFDVLSHEVVDLGLWFNGVQIPY